MKRITFFLACVLAMGLARAEEPATTQESRVVDRITIVRGMELHLHGELEPVEECRLAVCWTCKLSGEADGSLRAEFRLEALRLERSAGQAIELQTDVPRRIVLCRDASGKWSAVQPEELEAPRQELAEFCLDSRPVLELGDPKSTIPEIFREFELPERPDSAQLLASMLIPFWWAGGCADVDLLRATSALGITGPGRPAAAARLPDLELTSRDDTGGTWFVELRSPWRKTPAPAPDKPREQAGDRGRFGLAWALSASHDGRHFHQSLELQWSALAPVFLPDEEEPDAPADPNDSDPDMDEARTDGLCVAKVVVTVRRVVERIAP